MNKKVIIDLNGVVFEPVDRNFSEVARADYGRVKGAALTLAYKYGLGRRGECPASLSSAYFQKSA